MAAFGAEQKHVTLPTDFRSPPENGHSGDGHLTASFAPKQALARFRVQVLIPRSSPRGIARVCVYNERATRAVGSAKPALRVDL
jgi:hypothetical protein